MLPLGLKLSGPCSIFSSSSVTLMNNNNLRVGYRNQRCVFCINCHRKRKRLEGKLQSLKNCVAIAVTGIVVSFGPYLGFDSFAVGEILNSCKEDQTLVRADETPLTNDGIVEEAWTVVNQNFIDARHHKWSTHAWLKMKEKILGKSISTREKAHDLIQKMLRTLNDPYTRFLTPFEFQKMSRYDLTGIGVNLKEVLDENGMHKLKVVGIILGGHAHSAGVKQGDELLSVNGQNVKGMTSFEASSLIQGPKDTFVSLEVKHGSCGETENVMVQRNQAARTPIFYRLEKADQGTDHIGYIRIKEFNSVAKRDFVTAINNLMNRGASYIVLDLRDNPGGIVQAGIEIAKLFLQAGETVIYTVGRDAYSESGIVAEHQPLVKTPLMVLVNGHTASASEIVAAALHDNCKAILVGEKTFGKGLIQSVYELRDGSAVVVTVGKYVAPSHKDIDGNGIDPDFSRRPDLIEINETLSRCQHQGILQS